MNEIIINQKIKIINMHNASKNVIYAMIHYKKPKDSKDDKEINKKTRVIFDLRFGEVTGCHDSTYINEIYKKQIWDTINEKFREYYKL